VQQTLLRIAKNANFDIVQILGVCWYWYFSETRLYFSSNLRFFSDCKNSEFFNRIIHRHLWTKIHKIFHSCKAPVYHNSMTGVTAEIFSRMEKTRHFHKCTCKKVHIQRWNVKVRRSIL